MTQIDNATKLWLSFNRHYRPYKAIPKMKILMPAAASFFCGGAIFGIIFSLGGYEFVASVFAAFGSLPLFTFAIAGIIDRWLTFYSLHKIKREMGYSSVSETIEQLEKEGFI